MTDRVELANFVLVPPLRCFHAEPSRPGLICGGFAHWMAVGTAIGMGGYFCDRHRPIHAAAIPDAAIFRRVRLTADVLLAGSSWDKSFAQADALLRLERAVKALGGYLDVKQATSELGQAGPQACRRAAGLMGAGR